MSIAMQAKSVFNNEALIDKSLVCGHPVEITYFSERKYRLQKLNGLYSGVFYNSREKIRF
jgi:hypothetical protein